MRKTPYLVSTGVLLVAIVFTVLSIALPDWLYADSPPNLPPGTHVRYGLYQRCESSTSNNLTEPLPTPGPHPIPGPSPPVDTPTTTVSAALTHVVAKKLIYHCHPFPVRSSCEALGEKFCVMWTTAGYISQISVVFALCGLVVLIIVSSHLSTRARRRSAWKLVSSVVAAHGALQITTMALVVHLIITEQHRFPDPDTHLYASFYLCVASIVLSLLLAVGLTYTGLSARAGHKWAAGKRPYEPIPDHPTTSSQLPS